MQISTRIIADPVPWSQLDPQAWDALSAAARGTFQSAHGSLAVWRRRVRLLGGRTAFLRLRAGDRVVGQCAAGWSAKGWELRDRLLLVPEAEALWPSAMLAVVGQLGPGRYHYGSSWTIEPPRQHRLAAMPGITVHGAREFSVQAIDFARFADWHDYWMTLNTSVRRQVRRASGLRELALARDCGMRALPLLPALFRAASAIRKRKGAPALGWSDFAHLGSVCAGLGDAALLLRARVGPRTMATQLHAAFGMDTCFLAGATRRDGPSVAWWLMMEAVREAQQRSPGGRFLLGRFMPDLHDEAVGGGLMRWRRHCRASDFAAATVVFESN